MKEDRKFWQEKCRRKTGYFRYKSVGRRLDVVDKTSVEEKLEIIARKVQKKTGCYCKTTIEENLYVLTRKM